MGGGGGSGAERSGATPPRCSAAGGTLRTSGMSGANKKGPPSSAPGWRGQGAGRGARARGGEGERGGERRGRAPRGGARRGRASPPGTCSAEHGGAGAAGTRGDPGGRGTVRDPAPCGTRRTMWDPGGSGTVRDPGAMQDPRARHEAGRRGAACTPMGAGGWGWGCPPPSRPRPRRPEPARSLPQPLAGRDVLGAGWEVGEASGGGHVQHPTCEAPPLPPAAVPAPSPDTAHPSPGGPKLPRFTPNSAGRARDGPRIPPPEGHCGPQAQHSLCSDPGELRGAKKRVSGIWLSSFFINYPSLGRGELSLFGDLTQDAMATAGKYCIRAHHYAAEIRSQEGRGQHEPPSLAPCMAARPPWVI